MLNIGVLFKVSLWNTSGYEQIQRFIVTNAG